MNEATGEEWRSDDPASELPKPRSTALPLPSPSELDRRSNGPRPVDADGAGLLDDVEEFFGRFVAFPSPDALVAVVLWTAHAHSVDSAESSPRLALLSPEPGSGKTRTLEVLDLLVPAPLSSVSASPAAIFRSLKLRRRCLLFDEVDAIFGRRGKDDGAEDLRALLNAGHRKGATIPRCVGQKHTVAEFPVFAAVALAGLGDLPDTLMSRSIIIRMRRRLTSEVIEPYRRRLHEPAGVDLNVRLALWTDSIAGLIAGAWPVMPAGVTDRPADVWEPLLAIADAAGGDWPGRARAACVELVKVSESREASLGIRLLGDLRTVFGEEERLSTETILKALHAMEEAPWSNLHGSPLDPRGLAWRLSPYEIESTRVWVAGKSLRGYRRGDLWDAWERYLTSSPESPPGPPGPEGPWSERRTAAKTIRRPLGCKALRENAHGSPR